jgi:anti-sigma factor RsiW
MNCRELVERTTDYLEDALDGDDRLRAADHLGVCTGCQAYVGEVQVTIQLMAGLPAEPLPAELEAGLLTMYRSWSESVSP